MHKTLVSINQQLKGLVDKVSSAIPNNEPFGNAHNNWSFPGLTRDELIEEAQSIIEMIEAHGADDIGNNDVRLSDYVRRLQHLQNTVTQMWGNSGQAVSAYMLTLGGLKKALVPSLARDVHGENVTKLRKLTTQLRGMEAKLKGLEPRTAALSTMVERISNAYSAADQLPADLESLSEARQDIEQIRKEATKDRDYLAEMREKADEFDKELRRSVEEADAVLKRCETAYSAATSVGLAAAFSERSSSLSKSMWTWVLGLILSLAAGSYFGSGQLQKLSELYGAANTGAANTFTHGLAINLVLSVLSIGAPVWFAWLATKQVSQRFKLAEDYAFKASISRAYEGFRRETARFDKEMEAKLLNSALSRLDELPLRLVDTADHGSPWHELASSDLVKQAMSKVPNFGEQVKSLAGKAIGKNEISRSVDEVTVAPADRV